MQDTERKALKWEHLPMVPGDDSSSAVVGVTAGIPFFTVTEHPLEVANGDYWLCGFRQWGTTAGGAPHPLGCEWKHRDLYHNTNGWLAFNAVGGVQDGGFGMVPATSPVFSNGKGCYVVWDGCAGWRLLESGASDLLSWQIRRAFKINVFAGVTTGWAPISWHTPVLAWTNDKGKTPWVDDYWYVGEPPHDMSGSESFVDITGADGASPSNAPDEGEETLPEGIDGRYRPNGETTTVSGFGQYKGPYTARVLANEHGWYLFLALNMMYPVWGLGPQVGQLEYVASSINENDPDDLSTFCGAYITTPGAGTFAYPAVFSGSFGCIGTCHFESHAAALLVGSAADLLYEGKQFWLSEQGEISRTGDGVRRYAVPSNQRHVVRIRRHAQDASESLSVCDYEYSGKRFPRLLMFPVESDSTPYSVEFIADNPTRITSAGGGASLLLPLIEPSVNPVSGVVRRGDIIPVKGPDWQVDWDGVASVTGEIHWYASSVPEQPLPPLVNGAGWRLQGSSAWHTDVGDFETVPAGTYTIEFKPVDGYVTPDSVQVTVQAGERVGFVCPGYYEDTQATQA